MKLLHIGKKGIMDHYVKSDSFLGKMERVELPVGQPDEVYLKEAGDADFMIADAIAPISASLIEAMPNLKMIHSNGVAYNRIDLEAARKKGVYVCNSKGMNASAVAEQTVLLMLGMLRNVAVNDAAVREGRQINVKEGYMVRGDLTELGDCSVGLVGFGDIGRETAFLLAAHGVKEIYYYKRNPLQAAEEEIFAKELSACARRRDPRFAYKPLGELLAESDIVSLHLPVTPETVGMADAAFFGGMKDGAYFVNTARGELVDDAALIGALASGKLKMAALDTLNNEPVSIDNPLLNAPEIADKVLFSPHIGGISASSFRRSYEMIAEDIEDAACGRTPKRVVN